VGELDAVLEELREIREHLSILTFELRSRPMQLFEAEMLRTRNRINMFRAFDGKRNPAQVASVAGVSDQAVRDLIKDLQGPGFVTVRVVGGAQVATISTEGVLNWYFSHSQGHTSMSGGASE
jgi:hypothetical protein